MSKSSPVVEIDLRAHQTPVPSAAASLASTCPYASHATEEGTFEQAKKLALGCWLQSVDPVRVTPRPGEFFDEMVATLEKFSVSEAADIAVLSLGDITFVSPLQKGFFEKISVVERWNSY